MKINLIFTTNRAKGDRSQFHLLEEATISSSQSNEDLSPLNMDLMGDLQDVIFRNCYTVSDETNNKATSHSSKVNEFKKSIIKELIK